MKLTIFATEKDVLEPVKEGLVETFKLEVTPGGILSLMDEAYDEKRNQYDASVLLNYLLYQHSGLVLWIVNEDLFTGEMNFVFGQAAFGRGAVVSTARLNSKELRVKEAIHEVGHVIGLKHCDNNCVMRFSNSLYEAEKKPSGLCEECKSRLFR